MLNLIFDLICHSDFDLSRLVHVGVNPPSIRHIMQARLWHLRHKDARPQAGQTGTFCICSTDGEFKPRCTRTKKTRTKNFLSGFELWNNFLIFNVLNWW